MQKVSWDLWLFNTNYLIIQCVYYIYKINVNNGNYVHINQSNFYTSNYHVSLHAWLAGRPVRAILEIIAVWILFCSED